MHFHLTPTEAVVAYGVVSYAVGTFPTPTNKYAKWILGAIQFLLANTEKGKAAFAAPPPSPPPPSPPSTHS